MKPVYWILIKLSIWPTKKQQDWSHFYCLRLLAISERRYLRSYPNGNKLNKFLHPVTKRQMHLFLTFTYKWGGGGAGTPPPPEVFWSFFLDDKTSAPDVFNSCSFIIRTHFETSLVMVCIVNGRYFLTVARKSTATKSLHWHRRSVCKTDLVAFVGRELWRHQAEKRRVNHSQKVVMWVSQKQRAKWNFQVNLTTWPSEPRAKAQDLYVIYWYIAATEIVSILLRNSLNTPVYLEFSMVKKSL